MMSLHPHRAGFSPMSDRPLSEWGTRGPPWRAAPADAPRQLDAFPSLEASLCGSIRVNGDGELPGVRATMNEIMAQEIGGGCRPEVARAQVQRLAESYHRDVRLGRDKYPKRRD
jgi:hypothetical protein